jgi:hypothetical protein
VIVSPFDRNRHASVPCISHSCCKNSSGVRDAPIVEAGDTLAAQRSDAAYDQA